MNRNVIATLAAAVTLLCVTSSISTLQAEARNESIDTRVALIVTQLINDANLRVRRNTTASSFWMMPRQ